MLAVIEDIARDQQLNAYLDSLEPATCPFCGDELDEDNDCAKCDDHIYTETELEEIQADAQYDLMKDERI